MLRANPSPGRRGLLRRAALVVGVALGARTTAVAPAEAAPARPVSTELVWRGRYWHTHSADLRRGELPVRGDRVGHYAELLDATSGEKVGEFYAASFRANAPFGAGPFAATGLEVHTFSLADGTVTGQGVGDAGTGTFAIVGGTGRYAGARGTYTVTADPVEFGGDGSAEFRLTLLG